MYKFSENYNKPITAVCNSKQKLHLVPREISVDTLPSLREMYVYKAISHFIQQPSANSSFTEFKSVDLSFYNMYASKISLGVLALFYSLMIWDIKISDAIPLPEEQPHEDSGLPEQRNSRSSTLEMNCKLTTKTAAKYAHHNATVVSEKLNSMYNALQIIANVPGIDVYDIANNFYLIDVNYDPSPCDVSYYILIYNCYAQFKIILYLRCTAESLEYKIQVFMFYDTMFLFLSLIQVLQQVLNTSISYLQCFGDHIGDILINVTKKDVYSNASYIDSTFRDAVYEAYGNITVSRDMMHLVKTFPCQQSSTALLGGDECHSFEDITVYSVSIEI